jgi:hypothetical protein
VDDASRIARLCSDLRDRLLGVELHAAHHREFIPDGYPAPKPVRHALDAAVLSGYGQALRDVLAELSE